ncbi:hypothetical protein LCGC14_0404160 [marine sediment metagenome]|uniref:Uncharacterized protein n=1 Tax=marine sediment metagenome TaxID=412755 RepID=A0A0F9TDW2_9ZZZZ
MAKKYPVGTKIKYRGCHRPDVGKKGMIVGYIGSLVWIVVPGSHLAFDRYEDSEHKWSTNMGSLEILTIPNQQLLFDFACER